MFCEWLTIQNLVFWGAMEFRRIYTEFLGFDLIIDCKDSLEINYDDVEIQNSCSSTFSAFMVMCFYVDHNLVYDHCM